MVYIIFLGLLALFGVWLGGRFFSTNNILNITRQTAMVSIMAIAMVFVIATGNIDLSIGSIVALSALIIGLILQHTDSIILALLGGLGAGALIGFINGIFITKLKIPAFLATLGMMSIIRGTAMWTTDTSAVPIYNGVYNYVFGMGNIGPIPILLLWTLLALVVGYFALTKTAFGKKVLAVGGNATSARYTGVNVEKITILVFVISGVAAAFAGALYAGRMQAARYTFGTGAEMDAIAAVILGGTSMAGGTGSVIGAVVGALLVGMINNGLIIGGLDVAQQTIVQGAIIVLAVAIGNLSKKKTI